MILKKIRQLDKLTIATSGFVGKVISRLKKLIQYAKDNRQQ